MKKILFTFILVLAIGIWPILGLAQEALHSDTKKAEIEVLNVEIATRKDKIAQLEDIIEKYKKNIVQKQTEAVSLKNQLSIMDNQTAEIQAEIDIALEKIKQTQLEIDALNLTIFEKEQTMERQKTIIAKMVQSIHASDQKNYLEIMLSYDNFADFYDELKYTENIYVDLGRSVKNLRIAKEELEQKKQQVQAKKKLFENLSTELSNKKQDLIDQMGIKQNLLVETKGKEKQYQTLLASLKQQYQVIEGEVKTFEDKMRKKLEDQDKIQENGNVKMSWPVPSHYVTASFHDPDYPYRKVFEHSCMDIRAAQGTPLRAAASGYIAKARRCTTSACYAYVLIVHTGNISTVYGHLSEISTTDDAFVNAGDIIGYSGGRLGSVGAGPFVTAPHLHFEVRLNGIPVNPAGYLGD